MTHKKRGKTKRYSINYELIYGKKRTRGKKKMVKKHCCQECEKEGVFKQATYSTMGNKENNYYCKSHLLMLCELS